MITSNWTEANDCLKIKVFLLVQKILWMRYHLRYQIIFQALSLTLIIATTHLMSSWQNLLSNSLLKLNSETRSSFGFWKARLITFVSIWKSGFVVKGQWDFNKYIWCCLILYIHSNFRWLWLYLLTRLGQKSLLQNYSHSIPSTKHHFCKKKKKNRLMFPKFNQLICS